MGKLKLLLALFMGTLIVFTAQRVYYAKTDTLDSICSDILFTRLAVESQQYTRQIEYGLENGKSLDNFYNIQSILNSVKRCYSYTSGAYIISDDYRLLYSNSDDGSTAPRAISIRDFDDSNIYSVTKDADDFILTMPIYGRGEKIYGYLAMRIKSSAIGNTLSEFYVEYRLQAVILTILTFLSGSIIIIHLCRSKERLFRQCFGVITGPVCSYILVDGAVSILKLQIMIEGIIQQSISKITLSLQNDLDTVQQKGVAVGKIMDFNSWLFESGKNIPFIENLIYDKNYKITATVSEGYIGEQIWRYAAVILIVLLIAAAAGLSLRLIVGALERIIVKRNIKNANRAVE